MFEDVRAEVIENDVRRALPAIVSALLALGMGAFLAWRNFLLFHGAIEVFTAVLGFTIFTIGWNTRRLAIGNLFLFLSAAFLAVAVLGMLHMIAFWDPALFGAGPADLQLRLYVALRTCLAAAFLVAACLVNRKLAVPREAMFPFAVLVAVLLFYLCLHVGVTVASAPWLAAAQYLLGFLLLVAAALFWKQRSAMPPRILRLIVASLVTGAVGETLSAYGDDTGSLEVIAHFLIFVSYVFAYSALVSENLQRPFAGLFRDVVRAKEEAEEAVRAKRDFMAFIGHEIRTPMSNVIAGTHLLLQGQLSQEQRSDLGMIKESAESLVRLLNDLLEFSKLEAGKLGIEQDAFDVTHVVHQAVESFKATAASKDISLTWSIAPGVPPRVMGDAFRLRQIILNLVSNAIKFTDGGGVSLALEAGSLGSDGTVLLTFRVKDTGQGIPADQLGKIFERYEQADFTIAKRFGGAGLGLSICRMLIELMGGTIVVESEVGHGTQFVFKIPFPLPSGEKCAAARVAANGNVSSKKRADDRVLNVLLVDDDPVSQRMGRRVIETRGWTVTTAGSGDDAVRAWEMGRFDVVLMDMELGTTNGRAVARRFRESKRSENGRVPIVCVSGHSACGFHGECQSVGIDAHLSKPVQPAAMVDVIERLCGASRAE